tara:strand:- start:2029 stop:2181 length:153 start_codon:yes stop_codon:yes gene_type:complete
MIIGISDINILVQGSYNSKCLCFEIVMVSWVMVGVGGWWVWFGEKENVIS